MKYDKEIVLDLWKTDAHKINMGIKREKEHQAKSRQFTKDTKIIGNVKENDEESGYATFREDPWELPYPDKKIVIKIFGERMNWRGSLEEISARGIPQSIAANRGLPVFLLNLTGNKHVIYLEKVQKEGSMGKNIYAFTLINSKTKEMFPYTIQEDRLSLGSDWDVLDMTEEKIAKIDGAAFNVGGKFTIKLDTKNPFYYTKLKDVILLFAILLRFLEDVEDKLKDVIKELKANKKPIKITAKEAMLYLNPRRVAI